MEICFQASFFSQKNNFHGRTVPFCKCFLLLLNFQNSYSALFDSVRASTH